MVERATDIVNKLLPVLAHHVSPILLTGRDVKIITKKLYNAKSTCVSKCQSCGCRIRTVHNPEQTHTSQAQLVKHQITCITPYSFIGFTPYSLVCLNGHVLLPWMFDLQELWVSKGRMNSEKPTCTRSKGSVSLLSPSNRNPLQEASLMMAQCLCVSPKRIKIENQYIFVTEK